MTWNSLPPEIRLFVVDELIRPDYDYEENYCLTFSYVEAWAANVHNCMLVCKDLDAMIRDRLAAAMTVPPTMHGPSKSTLPPEVIISYFGEEVCFMALEKAIRLVETRARQIRENIGRGLGNCENGVVHTAESFVKHYLRQWLLRMVSRDFETCVRQLLDSGAEPDGPDPDRYSYPDRLFDYCPTDNYWMSAELYPSGSPLQIVANYACVDMRCLSMLELLITHGDVDFGRPSDIDGGHTYIPNGPSLGCRIFTMASSNNLISLAKLLLDKGVDPNQLDPDSQLTPLAAALMNNHVDFAVFLLDHGADMMNKSRPLILPFAAAAEHCSVETVSMLLKRGAEINAQTLGGMTAVGSAIAKNEPVARFLIDHGASISKSYIDDAIRGRVRMPFFQLLLDKLSDVGFERPLYHAARYGNVDVVRYFVDRGVKLEHFLSAENIATGNLEIAKMLVDAGANLGTWEGVCCSHCSRQKKIHENPLYHAAMIGSAEIVELLVDRGINVNTHWGSCERALQIAAAQGREQVVRLLLERGADVNHRGGTYGSALGAAIFAEHTAIQELLLEYGHPPSSS